MTIVIAGAGLSGLTLAAHLTRRPPRCEVLIVDDGGKDITAAGWGSWSDRPGLLDTAARHHWDRVHVHALGRSRLLDLGAYRYRYVRGADLAATVTPMLESAPGFRRVRGHVDDIVEAGVEAGVGTGGAARVVVDGEPTEARWVFDSVLGPSDPPPADAVLVFRGWHLETEAEVFDPRVPTLFDFRTPRSVGASFVYVLPFGGRHALVEHTTFAAPAVACVAADSDTQRAALAEYLDTVLRVGRYRVEREEAAALPLSAQPVRRRRGHVLAIGTAAGLLKPSTGYAYERIQRDSVAIADSLAEHGHPFAVAEPSRRHRLLDGALLDVITARPSELERAFARLFDRSSAEPVLRFLDERTSVREEAALFTALPAVEYARAAAGRWRRNR
ncbi:lycopene beta-cyclase [Saccharomonospora amisosensis]|uniref:Lycopene beta-cyclase n=1 Tax=Saccharomonospora amisosensis TaxID=1128677 RepID=A0A7X5ZQX0_9PSEU|nr:lycopene cyclase family protein [Saccharomonospora amisosensis]NIJ12293.1 lycopene beta-cyclase [Saccharomonospora amisosensis]